MTSRFVASRACRALLLQALRPATCHRQVLINPNLSLSHPDELGRFSIGQLRAMSTSIARLPEIADSDVLQALRGLMAVNWLEISEEAKDAVEAALTKKTDDTAGQEDLKNAWRAAEAVEKFSGTLVTIRMALDDLTGASGEKVRPLPPLLIDALKSALSRYNNYLAAFNEDEFYLKKKVEFELGSLLVHIRQRCSGLGPEWANISLIGTSGISGSFVEYRAH
eukprot:c19454_g1_i1 orf=203-871(+)